MVGAGRKAIGHLRLLRIMNEGIGLANVLEKSRVVAYVYEFVSSTQFNGKFILLADGKTHVGVSLSPYMLFAVCG